jgi:RND family efflux transporter MFP subunit
MSADQPPPDHPPAADHSRLRRAGLVALIIAVVVVAIGLISRGLAGQQLKAATLTDAVPTVNLIRPTVNGGDQALTLPGDVQANYDAVIHARVSGYLKKWYVDIGAPVKAGQVLADIDTPELDQQLAQAKADLATARANGTLAKITADRWAGLLVKDAVSKQESDEKTGDLAAKTALTQAAQANVDRLVALEAFKHIVAPFNGMVTARNTDIGALIAAGNPTDPGLFTVADESRLRIYVHAPQAYIAQIKAGQTAAIAVPEHPGQTFQADVTSTSDAVSSQSGTLTVELQIDNSQGQLKPGDYAQVAFSLPRAAGGVSLPASALMFRKSGLAVATLGLDNRVVMKPVAIAEDHGQVVDIASGLQPNDRVIDNPPDSLASHDLVRVASGG